MREAGSEKPGWRGKILHEMGKFYLNFVYLALFFSLFTWYRRLTLAQYDISYLNYGVSIIEALILAKVIMLGDAMRLGRGFDDKPLIIPTIYKAVAFTVWVAVFTGIEHIAKGVLTGKGAVWGLNELAGRGKYELLARCLVLFSAFVPFFALRELGRVMGEGNLRQLFFTGKAIPGSHGRK